MSLVDSRAYELLVRDVYQALVDQDALRNVDVRHDVRVSGRSGLEHQVDVYWEFTVAGVAYRTCIECRRHKRPVAKSQVAAFAKIVEDIGNATGIIVTTEGFQSGARKLATHERIRIVRVNPLIRELHLHSHISIPRIDSFELLLNAEHAASRLREAGLETIRIETRGMPDQIVFVDADGFAKTSAEQIIAQTEFREGAHRIGLDDTFFKTPIGLVRVDAVSFRVHVTETNETRVLGGNHIARALVEDVLTNIQQYVHADGTVSVTKTSEPP